MKSIQRDRPLTAEEIEKYNRIRKELHDELPELLAKASVQKYGIQPPPSNRSSERIGAAIVPQLACLTLLDGECYGAPGKNSQRGRETIFRGRER